MFLVLVFAMCVNLLFGRGLSQHLLRWRNGRASDKRKRPAMIMTSLEMVLTLA